MEIIVKKGYTFDDVLLIPQYSRILPTEVNVSTRVTRNIRINAPVVSAAMDTVTESRLAIALAQEGGVGVIHKNMTIEQQAAEVETVKRSESGVITDPVTLPPSETVGTAQSVMNSHKISGIPVIDENGKLAGIITRRDLRFQKAPKKKIQEVMTKSQLITAPENTSLDEAKDILHQQKVEKLLLVDQSGALKGMITIKDINLLETHPNACKDPRGRLRVGAAVSPGEYDRMEALMMQDVDFLVVDTAHGHSKNVIETVKEAKNRYSVEIIAGNIATAEAAKALLDAGADGIKVGIGPGSICTTRIIAGVGVPQITAVNDVCRVIKEADVPLIADGGIRHSGDITKAIAAGADCVMLGSLLAGLNESPGEVITYKGRRFKTYRGMGSTGAMVKGAKSRYGQDDIVEDTKLVPEGVEGRVPLKGPLNEFVYQLVGGLRAGMGYLGAKTIPDLQQKAKFLQITNAGLTESHPHGIQITKEASNYKLEID
ncbi:MAG: IMP dehydrogenase [Planctomycetota bacterium]|jgi:IMP dehydrogenase